jgi:CRP-like cAMP-binding protein
MKPATESPTPARATGTEPVPSSSLFAFDKLSVVARGTVLFREGEAATGVYLLQNGEVTLSLAGPERARTQTVRPGELLGVMAVISNRPHLTTAVAVTDCEVGFIASDEFRRLIDESPVVWFSVLRQLSQDVNTSYDTYREVGAR